MFPPSKFLIKTKHLSGNINKVDILNYFQDMKNAERERKSLQLAIDCHQICALTGEGDRFIIIISE